MHHRRGGSRGSRWANFIFFFRKNSRLNAIWITFCTFLDPFEITKFLGFESQLKTSNCWVFILLTDQVQKRLKSWILELNFVCDLAQVDEALQSRLPPVIFLAVNNYLSTFGDFRVVIKITSFRSASTTRGLRQGHLKREGLSRAIWRHSM